jgi:hypothetical protein
MNPLVPTISLVDYQPSPKALEESLVGQNPIKLEPPKIKDLQEARDE